MACTDKPAFRELDANRGENSGFIASPLGICWINLGQAASCSEFILADRQDCSRRIRRQFLADSRWSVWLIATGKRLSLDSQGAAAPMHSSCPCLIVAANLLRENIGKVLAAERTSPTPAPLWLRQSRFKS